MFDEILLTIFSMELGDKLEYKTNKGVLVIDTYITDIQEIEFILYNVHTQELERIVCEFDNEELSETLYYILE